MVRVGVIMCGIVYFKTFSLPALQRAVSIGFSVFSFQSGPRVHNQNAPTPEKSD